MSLSRRDLLKSALAGSALALWPKNAVTAMVAAFASVAASNFLIFKNLSIVQGYMCV